MRLGSTVARTRSLFPLCLRWRWLSLILRQVPAYLLPLQPLVPVAPAGPLLPAICQRGAPYHRALCVIPLRPHQPCRHASYREPPPLPHTHTYMSSRNRATSISKPTIAIALHQKARHNAIVRCMRAPKWLYRTHHRRPSAQFAKSRTAWPIIVTSCPPHPQRLRSSMWSRPGTTWLRQDATLQFSCSWHLQSAS